MVTGYRILEMISYYQRIHIVSEYKGRGYNHIGRRVERTQN